MSLTHRDIIFAHNVKTLETQTRILKKMDRFISPGFCRQCGSEDGMQALDWVGVRQLSDEDIYTSADGNMYTTCFHCNTGQIVPEGYWQAEPHAAMVWAIADRQSALDEIGDDTAEREAWTRQYERPE